MEESSINASDFGFGYLDFYLKKGFQRYFLTEGENTIGNSLNADIRFKNISNPEPIFCIINVKRNGVATVTNKCKKDLLTVNNEKVKDHKVLRNGDLIAIKGKNFEYVNDLHTNEEIDQLVQEKPSSMNRKSIVVPERTQILSSKEASLNGKRKKLSLPSQSVPSKIPVRKPNIFKRNPNLRTSLFKVNTRSSLDSNMKINSKNSPTPICDTTIPEDFLFNISDSVEQKPIKNSPAKSMNYNQIAVPSNTMMKLKSVSSESNISLSPLMLVDSPNEDTDDKEYKSRSSIRKSQSIKKNESRDSLLKENSPAKSMNYNEIASPSNKMMKLKSVSSESNFSLSPLMLVDSPNEDTDDKEYKTRSSIRKSQSINKFESRDSLLRGNELTENQNTTGFNDRSFGRNTRKSRQSLVVNFNELISQNLLKDETSNDEIDTKSMLFQKSIRKSVLDKSLQNESAARKSLPKTLVKSEFKNEDQEESSSNDELETKYEPAINHSRKSTRKSLGNESFVSKSVSRRSLVKSELDIEDQEKVSSYDELETKNISAINQSSKSLRKSVENESVAKKSLSRKSISTSELDTEDQKEASSSDESKIKTLSTTNQSRKSMRKSLRNESAAKKSLSRKSIGTSEFETEDYEDASSNDELEIKNLSTTNQSRKSLRKSVGNESISRKSLSRKSLVKNETEDQEETSSNDDSKRKTLPTINQSRKSMRKSVGNESIARKSLSRKSLGTSDTEDQEEASSSDKSKRITLPNQTQKSMRKSVANESVASSARKSLSRKSVGTSEFDTEDHEEASSNDESEIKTLSTTNPSRKSMRKSVANESIASSARKSLSRKSLGTSEFDTEDHEEASSNDELEIKNLSTSNQSRRSMRKSIGNEAIPRKSLSRKSLGTSETEDQEEVSSNDDSKRKTLPTINQSRKSMSKSVGNESIVSSARKSLSRKSFGTSEFDTEDQEEFSSNDESEIKTLSTTNQSRKSMRKSVANESIASSARKSLSRKSLGTSEFDTEDHEEALSNDELEIKNLSKCNEARRSMRKSIGNESIPRKSLSRKSLGTSETEDQEEVSSNDDSKRKTLPTINQSQKSMRKSVGNESIASSARKSLSRKSFGTSEFDTEDQEESSSNDESEIKTLSITNQSRKSMRKSVVNESIPRKSLPRKSLGTSETEDQEEASSNDDSKRKTLPTNQSRKSMSKSVGNESIANSTRKSSRKSLGSSEFDTEDQKEASSNDESEIKTLSITNQSRKSMRKSVVNESIPRKSLPRKSLGTSETEDQEEASSNDDSKRKTLPTNQSRKSMSKSVGNESIANSTRKSSRKSLGSSEFDTEDQKEASSNDESEIKTLSTSNQSQRSMRKSVGNESFTNRSLSRKSQNNSDFKIENKDEISNDESQTKALSASIRSLRSLRKSNNNTLLDISDSDVSPEKYFERKSTTIQNVSFNDSDVGIIDDDTKISSASIQSQNNLVKNLSNVTTRSTRNSVCFDKRYTIAGCDDSKELNETPLSKKDRVSNKTMEIDSDTDVNEEQEKSAYKSSIVIETPKLEHTYDFKTSTAKKCSSFSISKADHTYCKSRRTLSSFDSEESECNIDDLEKTFPTKRLQRNESHLLNVTPQVNNLSRSKSVLQNDIDISPILPDKKSKSLISNLRTPNQPRKLSLKTGVRWSKSLTSFQPNLSEKKIGNSVNTPKKSRLSLNNMSTNRSTFSKNVCDTNSSVEITSLLTSGVSVRSSSNLSEKSPSISNDNMKSKNSTYSDYTSETIHSKSRKSSVNSKTYIKGDVKDDTNVNTSLDSSLDIKDTSSSIQMDLRIANSLLAKNSEYFRESVGVKSDSYFPSPILPDDSVGNTYLSKLQTPDIGSFKNRRSSRTRRSLVLEDFDYTFPKRSKSLTSQNSHILNDKLQDSASGGMSSGFNSNSVIILNDSSDDKSNDEVKLRKNGKVKSFGQTVIVIDDTVADNNDLSGEEEIHLQRSDRRSQSTIYQPITEDITPADPNVLKTQNSPRNDLTDIVGVKKLFASPRYLKSPKNDLSNVPNLRNIVSPKEQNSPKNRLSVFPGVKSLFKTPKAVKEPKNDLTKIPNLKRLMSPKQQKSPANRLSDFCGVKKLLSSPVGNPQIINTSTNTSDIENNEELFSKVFDKKPLKTYRSKSLNLSPKKIDAFGALRKSILDAPCTSPRIQEWVKEQAALKTMTSTETDTTDTISPQKSISKRKRNIKDTSSEEPEAKKGIEMNTLEKDDSMESTPADPVENKRKRGIIETPSSINRPKRGKRERHVKFTPDTVSPAVNRTAKQIMDSKKFEEQVENLNKNEFTEKTEVKRRGMRRKEKFEDNSDKLSEGIVNAKAPKLRSRGGRKNIEEEEDVDNCNMKTYENTNVVKEPAKKRTRRGTGKNEEITEESVPVEMASRTKITKKEVPEDNSTEETLTKTRSKDKKLDAIENSNIISDQETKEEPIKKTTRTRRVKNEKEVDSTPTKNLSRTKRQEKENKTNAEETPTRTTRSKNKINQSEDVISDQETKIEPEIKTRGRGKRAKKEELALVESENKINQSEDVIIEEVMSKEPIKTRGQRGKKVELVPTENENKSGQSEDVIIDKGLNKELIKTTRGRRGKKEELVPKENENKISQSEDLFIDEETNKQPIKTTRGRRGKKEELVPKENEKKIDQYEDVFIDEEKNEESIKTTRGRRGKKEKLVLPENEKKINQNEDLIIEDEKKELNKKTRGRRGKKEESVPAENENKIAQNEDVIIEEETNKEPIKKTRGRRGKKEELVLSENENKIDQSKDIIIEEETKKESIKETRSRRGKRKELVPTENETKSKHVEDDTEQERIKEPIKRTRARRGTNEESTPIKRTRRGQIISEEIESDSATEKEVPTRTLRGKRAGRLV